MTRLHIKAHVRRQTTQMEMAAWQVMHLYKAMCGHDTTVDELMGRTGEKIDLVNDPFALDKLADAE